MTLVTISFTAAGGDAYPTLAATPNVRPRDDSGALVTYEQALRELLASFPAGADGLPAVPAGPYDTPTSGRITIL